MPDSVDEVCGELLIGGEVVPTSGLSVSRSIPSSLPDQVAGVGGYKAATGSATVLQAAPVSDRSPTPWGGQTPQPLAPVEAFTVTNGLRERVFTGVIDKASGKASDSDTPVGLVDSSDRLNRAVSLDPMCRIMPAPSTDGSTNELNSDLFSTYLVDKVLRACEFYATPPRIGFCVMSAPLQGSSWPEIGSLRYSARGASHTESPFWATAPWGVAAHHLRADYTPDLARWSSIDGRLTRPMEIVLCAGTTQWTSGRVTAEWSTGAKLSVAVTSSRSVLVQTMFPSSQGSWQTVLTATTATLGAWRNVTARFIPRSDGRMDVQLRTNNSGSASQLGTSIPYGCETAPMQNINIDLPENNIGGVQVGFPSNSVAFSAAAHRPTAVLTPPVPFVPLVGSPAIVSTSAIDLLTEWAKAECAAFWIDEDGVAQWRNRERLVSGPVDADLTSTTDLLDLEWSHDIQGAAARVVLEYKKFSVQRSKRSRIQVWQGSGQTMEPGDVHEEFASCPDDEIWINVDSSPDVFQAQLSKQQFNRGEGTWVGYTAYDKDGEEHGNGQYVGYTAAIEFISRTTYKIIQSFLGHVPTGVESIRTQTRDTGGVLKPQWQGFNLPVLRAQCRMTMADAQQTGTAGGPPEAPDLSHDVGWWVQDETAVRSLAFWLAQQTAKPRPVIDGIPVVGGGRRLGQIVTVTDTHRTGLRVTGVIIDVSQDVAAGDHAVTLRLLVISVQAMRPTLFEYDRLWGGAALEARDAVWDKQTLGAFDSAPLTRR